MNSTNLIRCVAGELYADPEIILEIIQDSEELIALVKKYLSGTTDYETVRDSVSEYC